MRGGRQPLPQHVDRGVEPPYSFEAPAQPQPCLDPLGMLFCHGGERRKRLLKPAESPQALALEQAGVGAGAGRLGKLPDRRQPTEEELFPVKIPPRSIDLLPMLLDGLLNLSVPPNFAKEF